MRATRSQPRGAIVAAILLLCLVLALELGGAGVSVTRNTPGPTSPQTLESAVRGVQFGASPFIVGPASGQADTVIATIPDVSSPATGTFDPANGDVYVPDSTGGLETGSNTTNLTVISGATNSVVAQSFLGVNAYLPTPTYAPSSSEIYVADQNGSTGMDNVTVFSGTDRLAANIGTGFESWPSSPVYDPVNKYLYVSDQNTEAFIAYPLDNVSVINTMTNTLVTQIVVGDGPITGIYDPADGDIYVPNFEQGSGTNLSIIDAATNTVIATISGLDSPYTPAYDPVNQEVYVPNAGGDNLTILKGTSVVGSIAVPAANTGDLLAPPAVDPVNGELFETLWASSAMMIISPSNTVVATIPVAPNSFLNFPATY